MTTLDLQTRKASVRRNSYNPETRTLTIVAATDTPVRMLGVEESLACSAGAVNLERMPVPLLKDHRRALDDQLGTVLRVWFDGGAMLAEVQLTERAAGVYGRDLEAGHSFGASVGYSIDSHVETGPRARRVSRWTLHEISLTPVGADPRAKTRSLPATQTGDSAMENEEVLESPPADPQTRAATVGEVLTIARAASLDDAFIIAQEGRSIEQVRAAALAEQQARTPRITVRSPETDNPAILTRDLGDALYARASGSAPSERARQFMHFGFRDFAGEALRIAGVSTRGMSPDELFRRALGISDFPDLLTGVGNRTLQAAYQAAASPLSVLFAVRSAPDFRPLQNLKFDGKGGFERISEHGEIKSVSFVESKDSYALDTYALRWDFTRKAMINDDLQALSRGPQLAGRQAAEKEAALLVAMLESNPTVEGAVMFSTGRDTLASTPSHILDGSGDPTPLSEMRKAMRLMKSLDGVTPIASTPKYLVVHPARETQAEMALAAISAARIEDVNPFSGKLQLLVEPRLTSETAWYVFADPANGHNFERCYLNGQQGPTLESNPSWETLGMGWRAWMDIGCGAVDWRFARKNAGSS